MQPSASAEFEISPEVRKKISNSEWLKAQFHEGRVCQEILGLTDFSMDKLYTAAVNILQNKRYLDAAHAFFFLVTLNPYHYDYWLGLGTAIQRCDDYEGAIDAYEMAAICNLDNPIPYLHLAKCLFAMHDRTSALQAIELALEYSADSTNYSEIHHQAQTAKSLLLKDG